MPPLLFGELVLAEPSAHVCTGAGVVCLQCCYQEVDLVCDRVEVDALVSQGAAAAVPHLGLLVAVGGFGVLAAGEDLREAFV